MPPRDINQQKVEEADQLFKKGMKYISPSLLDFRLKPDWEAAAPYFDKAAMMYKLAGDQYKALEAYERAAVAQEKLGSPWHAAKHIEVCAELLRPHEQWEKMAEYYRQAAELYMRCGKGVAAADCLARGAKVLEDPLWETAFRLYLEALELYEMENKEVNSYDQFRNCINGCVKAKMYEDAAQVLMRFGTALDKTGARSSQCKAYLGAVVCLLNQGDGKAAWHLYQDCLQVDVFVSSEEAFAADALFMAYRSGDEAAVSSLVLGKQIFKHLEHRVAKLAVRLPAPGTAKKVAKALGKVMDANPEEEEEQEEELL